MKVADLTPQLPRDKKSPAPPGVTPLGTPDKNPVKLTKTPLFLLQLTNLALARDPSKGMCPRSYHILWLHPALTFPCCLWRQATDLLQTCAQ